MLFITEGAQQGYDAARNDDSQHKAISGDPVAQYKLANNYCCKSAGPLKEASIYDNKKASYWYCKSAKQGYAPAQLQLGRIYSRDPLRGIHVLLRASDLAGSHPVNLAVAQMWAELAA
ncbi:MAG: hypothetical protein ABI475_04180 [Methylophilaceae bacterium]